MPHHFKKEAEEIEEGKIFAILAYLSILCIIPLILKKDNKFCIFHARQGLILFILEVAIFVLSVIPFVGVILWRLGVLFFGLLSIWCIIQVLLGRYSRIPFVAEFAEKITL
ncbi:MAG: hypothetical protein Q8O13_03065 [Candidatus Omnitrophota bacterium]|nr:hypothetical protein [Candidatus Omnitrophota bacterium]